MNLKDKAVVITESAASAISSGFASRFSGIVESVLSRILGDIFATSRVSQNPGAIPATRIL
jgi:hypothetical protein